MTESIASLFKSTTKPPAQKRLTDAYRQLFTGNGDKTDAEIVLADLAQYSGYFHVPTDLDHATLAHDAGKRSVLGRIIHLSKLPPPVQEQLLEAVRLSDYYDAIAADRGDYDDIQ